MKVILTDGGRAAAGLPKGGDCVTRAIALASGLPYAHIWNLVAQVNAAMPKTRRRKKTVGKHTASAGVYTESKLFKDLMHKLGFVWTTTMTIGSGCQVHLRDGELPPGRIIARVTRHYTAVIDGVIYDMHDPSRGGTRCVYGYWTFTGKVYLSPEKKYAAGVLNVVDSFVKPAQR